MTNDLNLLQKFVIFIKFSRFDIDRIISAFAASKQRQSAAKRRERSANSRHREVVEKPVMSRVTCALNAV